MRQLFEGVPDKGGEGSRIDHKSLFPVGGHLHGSQKLKRNGVFAPFGIGLNRAKKELAEQAEMLCPYPAARCRCLPLLLRAFHASNYVYIRVFGLTILKKHIV